MNQTRSVAYFRASDWWIGKASALLALVYGYAYWFRLSVVDFIPLAIASLLTIVGFAVLGYQLNDWYDQPSDALSGKANMFAGKSKGTVIRYFLLSLGLLFFPWIYLPADRLSIALISAQLCAFLLYVHPFTRWKEKPLLGIVADTLYAHVIPTLLSLHTFSLAAEKKVPLAIYILLTAAQFVNGLRNILLHRLMDAGADKKAKVFNEMIAADQQKVQQLVRGLIPVEALFTLSWLFLLLQADRWIWILFTSMYLLLYLLSFQRERMKQTPVLRKLNWAHFPNFMWEWALAGLFLSCLVCQDISFLGLALFHVLLFYSYETADYLSRLMQKSSHFMLQYIYYPTNRMLSLLVNYAIYYFMRLLGVDLIREKTTFLGYWRSKRKNS